MYLYFKMLFIPVMAKPNFYQKFVLHDPSENHNLLIWSSGNILKTVVLLNSFVEMLILSILLRIL